MDDIHERIETLKAEAARTRVDHLQTALDTVKVYANLAETEQQLGDLDGARKALQRAEHSLASARGFLSNPKHQMSGEVRQELSRRADSLRSRLDDLKRSLG